MTGKMTQCLVHRHRFETCVLQTDGLQTIVQGVQVPPGIQKPPA